MSLFLLFSSDLTVTQMEVPLLNRATWHISGILLNRATNGTTGDTIHHFYSRKIVMEVFNRFITTLPFVYACCFVMH